jgi:hypothetical protein
MNVKGQNWILKSKTLNLFQGKVQNDTLVMPNQVLNHAMNQVKSS